MGFVSFLGPKDKIPWAYRDRICTCKISYTERIDHLEQERRKQRKSDREFNARKVRCARCGLYYDTVLNRCDYPGCGRLFLWTYDSPNFCHHDYRCYEHLRTEPCDHPWCRYCFDGVVFHVVEADGIPKPPPQLDVASITDLDLDF